MLDNNRYSHIGKRYNIHITKCSRTSTAPLYIINRDYIPNSYSYQYVFVVQTIYQPPAPTPAHMMPMPSVATIPSPSPPPLQLPHNMERFMGIGRAIAKQLVACGAETFALSRTQDDLDTLKAENPDMHIIQLDITHWDRTREELAKIAPVDLLVNNAGIPRMNGFLNTTEEEVIAKGMIEKDRGGVIVNISSVLSEIAKSNVSVYSSSKAALDMLTKCMALELGPNNIRVNAVNPTIVWTENVIKNADWIHKQFVWLERTPLGRFSECEDVVNMVVYLLSEQSGMITGQCIMIDGGLGLS